MAEDTKDVILKEKETTYGASYPYNQVTMTSQGLTIEIDDTLGAPRYQVYHPIGSFYEIQQDGDVVTKTAKDLHFIVGGGNKKKGIPSGNFIMQVTGNSDTAIAKNYSFNINGNSLTTVKGNIEEIGLAEKVIKIGKNLKTIVGEVFSVTAGKIVSLSAKTISIRAGNSASSGLVSNGSLNLSAERNLNLDSRSGVFVTAAKDIDMKAPKLEIEATSKITGDVTVTGNVVINGGFTVSA